MSDLHDRFGDWLTDGARVELPRDAALHASACAVCLREAAAFDALLAIDPGAAPAPPLLSTVPARRRPSLGMLRAGVGVAAVLLLAISVGIGAGGLLDRRAEVGSELSSPTPDGEGILAGAGGPASSAAASEPRESTSAGPSGSAEGSASPEASADVPQPTPVPAFSTPRPIVTPRPSAITPPIGTTRPSASSAATPAPTAVPSVPPTPPPPTASPTPVPTPVTTPVATPPPPQCSDDIDNDGDLLTDFPVDLGCSSADDDDESDLP